MYRHTTESAKNLVRVFGRRLVERADLGLAEVPEPSGPELAQRERTDPGTDEPADRVSEGVEHPADDPVAPVVDDDLDLGGPVRRCDHPGRVGAGRTVVEIDAGPQLLDQ